MNILCIDTNYAGILSHMGHEVLAPKVQPGVVSLPELLERHAFRPDLLIQRERLNIRVILDGLAECPCPTVFISIDTHLNLYWQKYYARLFDLVLTPHLSLLRSPESAFGLAGGRGGSPGKVRRLRHAGQELHWRGHASRSHALSFCGVVDRHRPLRKAMLELLASRYPLHRPEGRLEFADMLNLFADSRIIPNESISREVNFRLFEGASCGCLVLGQNVGEDQDVCFTPGKEVVLYENSLDLLDKCGFYLKNAPAAEKIARKAWERVQAEHLPRHRATELLAMSAESASNPGVRASGKAAEQAFYLTLLQLARHGSHKLNTAWLLKRLGAFPEEPECAAGILVLLAEAGQPESPIYRAKEAGLYKAQGLDFCRELLRVGLHAESEECNLAASAFALLMGEPELAVRFCARQAANVRAGETKLASSGNTAEGVGPHEVGPGADPGGSGQAVESAGAANRYTLTSAGSAPFDAFMQAVRSGVVDQSRLLYLFYIAWAQALLVSGRLAQPGFQLRIQRGFMPQSALECLFLAQLELESGATVDAGNAELMGLLHQVCSRLPGYEGMDMGFMAYLSLYDQRNWEMQARYGLVGLRCLKLEEPLCELVEAGGRALQAGEEESFFRLLAEAPASEYIRKVVEDLLRPEAF